MEAAKVVNMVRYIPVAEATKGCMSIYVNNELNTVPGPTPHIEAKNAPRNEKNASLKVLLGENF